MRVKGINLEGYILKYFIFGVLYILKYCVICFACSWILEPFQKRSGKIWVGYSVTRYVNQENNEVYYEVQLRSLVLIHEKWPLYPFLDKLLF